jgi:phosphatidylserine decarboxylase
VVFPCDVNVRKGDELGWFEHGSTIILLAPDHFEFCDDVTEGMRIRAGQPLLRKPAHGWLNGPGNRIFAAAMIR